MNGISEIHRWAHSDYFDQQLEQEEDTEDHAGYVVISSLLQRERVAIEAQEKNVSHYKCLDQVVELV